MRSFPLDAAVTQRRKEPLKMWRRGLLLWGPFAVVGALQRSLGGQRVLRGAPSDWVVENLDAEAVQVHVRAWTLPFFCGIFRLLRRDLRGVVLCRAVGCVKQGESFGLTLAWSLGNKTTTNPGVAGWRRGRAPPRWPPLRSGDDFPRGLQGTDL
eukprot:scaffold106_cov246-Pinguiococcus_pyrenoidosus.AAC.15